VDLTTSGHEGERMAVQGSYDGIVLDLLLPDTDGVQICKNLRRSNVATPILMLTALSGTEQKVTGLNAGADDYLTKPFAMDELVARVRALLRRAQATESTTLQFEDLQMDLLKRTVQRDSKMIRLTTTEFALLEYFLRNPNRVVTRSILGERVWNLIFEEESNVVEVYISRLRRKVDRGFSKPLLHTIVGTGYILSAEPPPV
jgi:DNA-binding response OmpR family regulator